MTKKTAVVKPMSTQKRERLVDAGWTVGSTADFLGLSAEEAAVVEMRVALAAALKQRRVDLGLSQSALAEELGSSQSRVAKMESADPSVSLDLLVRALIASGVSRRALGRVISAA
jgi:ribosome-binding protein aMBF1 (putative translation factor)